ncbi:MAG TPA: HAMP domain-containing sensor histidine kinase [Vicinamibacteria bacterium]|nr:HAMP domain-containing sensor histidine kinase [Vicinamibacteria bacterium]
MSERRRPPLRAAVLIVLLFLGLVEVQSVVQTVRAQTRLRERVIRSLEAPVIATWPEIARVLRPGGTDAWQAGLQALLERSGATEAEILDLDGRLLASYPSAAPVSHWPSASRVQSIATGMIFTWGPVAGQQTRLLTYAGFPSGGRPVVLRLAAPVPELVDDLKERRELLVGHGLVLILLALAAGLILMPQAPVSSPSPGIEAYAEALGRLRDQGQAQSQAHRVERDRLTGEMRDLEAMARAGELTAGIAHEVRNGLGTILGYARLLEQAGNTPEVVEAARGIRAECETQEAVVRAFMDFVRRETLQATPFEVGRLLERVAAREQARRPGAAVTLRGVADLRFTGDEELLERAFENIVRNAREAAGERGSVVVEAGADTERLRVAITDDGPGFPPGTDVARPFVSMRPGGLGLGLPIAIKIVTLHGGTVRLGSNPPRGARVEVDLPRAEAG